MERIFETATSNSLTGQTEALPLLWWLTPLAGICALLAAFAYYRWVMAKEEGTPKMIEIAGAVREGAMAYLSQQYRVIVLVFVVLFFFFLALAYFELVSLVTPFAFLVGGLFSGACGFIGMRAATQSSARTAQAAAQSLDRGLQVAFRGGAVMGLAVVGFAMLNISILFLVLYYFVPTTFFRVSNNLSEITTIMVSGVFGASMVALFARVGGGIFTKAADVGADLVGKVEAGIPEDDPRNPATIADNVGDNVGDVAGMGADLYESYMGSILATVSLGVSAALDLGGGVAEQLRFLTLPLALAAVGVLLSILGIQSVRVRGEGNVHELMAAMDRGIYLAAGGIALLALPLVFILNIYHPWQIWLTIVIGLLVGIIIGRVTEFYTSATYAPTRRIAAHGVSGPATVIIEGLAVGMRSSMYPVITVSAGIVFSFLLAGGTEHVLLGLYGVGLAAVAMLSTLGITLTTDAYGPIADNAGGNAQMAALPPEVRKRTDDLDAVGNTTAATGKGFAIGSAALTALALLAAFVEQIRFEYTHLLKVDSLVIAGRTVPIEQMSLRDFTIFYDVTPLNPALIVGLFTGAMCVFLFSSLTLAAVGRAALQMVLEVRRQFKSIPGIIDGSAKPDYARCVEISTASAQREMIAPALVAVLTPVIIGLLFGAAGVLGLLAGSLATGFVMAIMMANAGGAWDNAKKHIEQGEHGGKGSEPHKAAVVGDTVGDPFKDTCGPSIDILIKLMGIAAIVLAGLVVSLGPGGLLGRLAGLF